MKDVGYGAGYKYAHNYENNFAKQDFLPDAIKNVSIWKPQSNSFEKKFNDHLRGLCGERFIKTE